MNVRLCSIALAILAAPVAPLFCGCGKTRDETRPEGPASAQAIADDQKVPSEQATARAPVGSVRLAEALASWESGKRDDSLRQLLLIRWDDPAALADLPALNISEDRFNALPANDQTRRQVQEESLKLVPALKDIARHALSAGDEARASGDEATAQARYEAVRHLGEALSRPERLLVIQAVGRVIVGWARDKTLGSK